MKTRIYVTRKLWTDYGSLHNGTYKGSGYCEDQRDMQYLIKEWTLLGWPIWRKILDCEEIPVWAWAEMACSGFTSWKSKFAKYIRRDK